MEVRDGRSLWSRLGDRTRLWHGQLILLTFYVWSAAAQTADAPLQKLFAAAAEMQLRHSPEWTGSLLGRDDYNHLWTDWSADAIRKRQTERRELLKQADSPGKGKLSPEQKVLHEVLIYGLRQDIDSDRFPGELLSVDPLFTGPQIDIPQTIARMPRRTARDLENVLSRLRSVPAYIDQIIALLEEGRKRGVTQPAIILRDIPAQVQALGSAAPAASPLYAPFEKMPENISAAERERLAKEAARLLDSAVLPAFRRFGEYLQRQYLPAARATIARTALPDGKDWYASDVRQYTTTAMTPEQIHKVGVEEVARIRAAMQEVMRDVKFAGDFPAFVKFLRTDPQFYFTKPEDLLTAYRDICKRIDPELPRLFGRLPRMQYGVKPVEAFRAASETTARYEPGSADGRRPGYFVANTWKLETRPKYEMEALSLHEAVPGHHLQIGLALEAPVPAFRKIRNFNAFVEGWGLYAESLGEEIGFYRNPYSRFGRLSYEMWRACRLVVDTGMHALGWTRQRAIDYMLENSALTEQNVTVEVDRYIAWPGQALGYKIGELKIKELRAAAEKDLGAKFDVRAFHDELLSEGALPLDMLEQRMREWIRKQRTASM